MWAIGSAICCSHIYSQGHVVFCPPSAVIEQCLKWEPLCSTGRCIPPKIRHVSSHLLCAVCCVLLLLLQILNKVHLVGGVRGGAVTCEVCPAGTSCLLGATRNTSCSPGSYSTGATLPAAPLYAVRGMRRELGRGARAGDCACACATQAARRAARFAPPAASRAPAEPVRASSAHHSSRAMQRSVLTRMLRAEAFACPGARPAGLHCCPTGALSLPCCRCSMGSSWSGLAARVSC